MIIPIGHEDATVRRVPWVTLGAIALCLAVQLAGDVAAAGAGGVAYWAHVWGFVYPPAWTLLAEASSRPSPDPEAIDNFWALAVHLGREDEAIAAAPALRRRQQRPGAAPAPPQAPAAAS